RRRGGDSFPTRRSSDLVQGGNNFVQDPIEVDTEPYVSASPRWLKVSEGVGIAVRGTAYPDEYEGTSPNFTFKSKTTKIDVLSLRSEEHTSELQSRENVV